MLISTFARALVAMTLAAGLAAGLVGSAYAAPADDTKEATRLYQQGKLDQALVKVNAALAQQPKDAQSRFLKGLILTEQKKTSDAIQIFTGLTEDYPELPEPYNNLAVLYAGQGNYDKARAALELAIHTHPSYATAYENLGDIYAQLARRSYDKVLQLDKTNVSAQSKLAMVKDLFSASPKAAVTEPTKIASVAAAAKSEPARSAATPASSAAPATASVAAANPSVTEPAKPAVAKGATAEAQVTATVNAWAKAWASKDVAGYLGYYAADFETPDGLARDAWEAQRKARIEKPGTIEIDIKISKVTVKGNEATVVFRQLYQSGVVKSNNSKTLKFTRSGDRWLIRSERAAGAK